MPLLNVEPVPIDSPIVADRVPAEDWLAWFLNQWSVLGQAVRRVAPPPLTNQAGAIGTTAMRLGALPSGLYRISWALRIEVASGVSSSIALTLGWTHGGARTKPFAAVTTNALALPESGSVVARLDAPGTITYATAVVDNPVGTVRYGLDFVVEKLV